MSEALTTDILVCGLGPAGASAAAEAAKAGARVLAVERNARPGLPVQCAEFVPMMIGGELPALGDARVQGIDRMLTFVGGETPDPTPDFHGHMIDRARFDANLVERAGAAGARCRFASPVRAISHAGIVHLGDGTAIRTTVVVGADGPRSPVGKAIGAVNRELVETRQITVDLLRPHTGTDIFLHPEIVGGYAWLFPKGGRCNIGVGVIAAEKQRLKPLLAGLHDRLVAGERVGRAIHAHTGGALAVGGMIGPTGRIGDCPALLCGDAAGLTNPVTGAGINAAVISGRLAGEAAAAIVEGDREATEDYSGEIEALFGHSLALAAKRRRQVLERYDGTATPGARNLRDGWIAYPQYWTEDNSLPGSTGNGDARRTA